MDRSIWKRPAFWISAAGLAVMGGLFVSWCVKAEGVNKAGYTAAFAAAVLFMGMCLRFVPQWMRFWSKNESWEETVEQPHRTVPLFFLFLAVDLAVLLAVYAIRLGLGDTTTFSQNLNIWRYLDTDNYLNIAQRWYRYGEKGIVFFPGYAVAIRLMYYIIGDYRNAAFVVAALCYAASSCVLYRLMLLEFSAAGARRAVKYLAILPAAFFFAAPMSESLFFLLCVSSMYCARKQQWLPASILGGLAAFTRSLGVLMLAPLVLEAVAACVRERGQLGWKPCLARFAPLLLVPVGILAYLLINYRIYGDPFMFMYYEKASWGQSFGLFWSTAAYQTDIALHLLGTEDYPIALGLWLPNVAWCFSALLVMTVAAKKLRPSYTAWFIAYYFIAIGATNLISAPRYLVAAVPIFAGLVQVTENKKIDMALSALCICAEIYYLFAFAMRWDVY